MSEITNSIKDFKMEVVEELVEKANSLEPKLINNYVKPSSIIKVFSGEHDWETKKVDNIDKLSNYSLGKDDSICLDFGDHQVGYVSFKINPVGSPPDAPAHIRLKFGEHICEIAEDSSTYNGSISSSWIQEEYMHIDVLPAEIKLPRRYAFRYMEILVKDTSPKYKIVIEDVICNSVSSADMKYVKEIEGIDEDLIKIDKIAIKTLQDCMHSVFEDGPKRDRRLWIGDLRLQALANYETFKNNDLVKRCLYLFGGLQQNEGRVGACLFIEPKLLVDDTALFDYSLFFVSILLDYYEETKDDEALKDLWPIAYRQIELATRELDENYVVIDKDTWWCFIDWKDGLNKQAGAQSILIYTLKQALKLAQYVNDKEKEKFIEELVINTTNGFKKELWSEEKGFFISGQEKQISWASQVWAVLANVFEKNKNGEILDRLIEVKPDVNMVTPYMYHHFIEALILNDRKEEALKYIRYYWGGMLEDEADCFWELYDPENKYVSPYGSRIINSYCHAWSCTPTYFIRKYFL